MGSAGSINASGSAGSTGTGSTGQSGSGAGMTGTNGATTGASGTAVASGASGSTVSDGGSNDATLDATLDAPADAPIEVVRPPCGSQSTTGVNASSIIQFNDNGGWHWFQDERAVIDPHANKLIVGSTASGGSRDGQNEAVIYDLASRQGTRYTLPSSLATSNVDDHNAPALLIRPDGQYLAQWAGHRVDCLSRFSTFDGTRWSAERTFDWTPVGCPWAGAATNMITYSNPWYLGSDIFTMVRSVDTEPGILASTDNGQSWSYVGKLTPNLSAGFTAGYYKFWGNNTDRIDFVGTEAHPRDVDNSLYHGYVSNGRIYDSFGNVLDPSIQDAGSATSNGPGITQYTTVFKTGTTVGGVTLCRMWNYDIARYADGTISVLGQGRTNECESTITGSDPDKRAIYARFDGTQWTATYLVKMGPKLYADEEDYTGLAALDPDNPDVIFVSTVYDPNDDTTMTSYHEIYEGVTCDHGKTWKWVPITQNSTWDNLRPIVPKWDSSHLALLWLRGTFNSDQSYALSVVGLINNSNP
jgi:hypothetical protein